MINFGKDHQLERFGHFRDSGFDSRPVRPFLPQPLAGNRIPSSERCPGEAGQAALSDANARLTSVLTRRLR